MILPMFEGTGTRLKVVEAMAYGRPLVSTRFGAQGLGLEPETHYLAGEDPPEFAAALASLAAGAEAGGDAIEPMLARARKAAEGLFWPRISAGLVGAYQAAQEDLGSRKGEDGAEDLGT